MIKETNFGFTHFFIIILTLNSFVFPFTCGDHPDVKKLDLDGTTNEIESGLSQGSTPTLIIWGAADKWLSMDDVKKLANTNSEIDFIELAEAKHYPQEHWASDISQEIVQFFRRKVF